MSFAPLVMLSSLFPVPFAIIITTLLFMAGIASVNYLFPSDRTP